jgi:hypothetical protein
MRLHDVVVSPFCIEVTWFDFVLSNIHPSFPSEVSKLVSASAFFSLASDASGFATVEKEQPGSLTPMLGDKKVGMRYSLLFL